MYDVLNFLCIPVILSDDIIYAYSDQSGGPFNHSLFSIQLPQSLIYYTTLKQLSLYRNNKQLMGILPSGQLIYDLLESSYHQHGDYYYFNERRSRGSSSSSNSRSNNYSSVYINPLIHILQSISMLDIQILRNNMYHISSYYRYYQIKTSPTTTPTSNMSSSRNAFTSSTKATTTTTTSTIMNQIPLIDHYFPDGDAMTMLIQLLSLRKKKGLYNISNQCQLERKGRKHNYISRFTCDNKDKDDILLNRRR